MDSRFDNSVRRALEKWPDVPACYGWLRLDRRGRWLIQDQAISHRRTVEFLGRNYSYDEHGQWFIQNGPQRAYCTLDYTPWIYVLDGSDRILTHTGNEASDLRRVVIDDVGDLLFETEHGIGLLHDRDLGRFIQMLERQPQNAAADAGIAGLIADLHVGPDSDLKLYCYGRYVDVWPMRATDVSAEFGFVAAPSGDAPA